MFESKTCTKSIKSDKIRKKIMSERDFYIELHTEEGAIFNVSKDDIACSNYLSSIASKLSAITTIKLPSNISTPIAEAIVNYMKMSTGPAPENWLSDFINENMHQIDLLLEASYFLEINSLTDFIIKLIQKSIEKAHSIQDLREICGITNDFTPEEEADVIKQVSWALGPTKPTPF